MPTSAISSTNTVRSTFENTRMLGSPPAGSVPVVAASVEDAAVYVGNAAAPSVEAAARVEGAQEPVRQFKVFYRWGPTADINRLIAAGGLSVDNASEFVVNDMNFKGDGLYLAESPITAQIYGPAVAEVWIDQALIDDGHFEKFTSVGRDWWLGQIDDILEEKGFDLDRLNDGAYKGDEEKAAVLKQIGVRYKPFCGALLRRSQMAELARYSEEAKRPFFQQLLDQRIYEWSTGADGALSAMEYTHDGYCVGTLEPKYCTAENQATFRNMADIPEDERPTGSGYKGAELSGFDYDIKKLSKKMWIYKAWTAFYECREWIKNLFR